ncbi:MAG: hypothetical protein VYE40_10135 [Myxococcota bacterium]|nr:hypothetical protein [Myxococcota bacterium]MEC9441450.1 hypothetical protein [Myxococcota bacterium]
MRKLSCIALSLALLVLACDSNKAADPSKETSAQTSATQTTEEAKKDNEPAKAMATLDDSNCAQKVFTAEVVKKFAPKYEYIADASTMSIITGTCTLLKTPEFPTSIQVIIPEDRKNPDATTAELWAKYVKEGKSTPTEAEVTEMSKIVQAAADIERGMAQDNKDELAKIDAKTKQQIEDYKAQVVESKLTKLDVGEKAVLMKTVTTVGDKATEDHEAWVIVNGTLFSISTTEVTDEKLTLEIVNTLVPQLATL